METKFPAMRSQSAKQIVAIISKHGPITAREIAGRDDVLCPDVGAVISGLRCRNPGLIRIASWKLVELGGSMSWNGAYEMGSEPDATKPMLSKRSLPRKRAKPSDDLVPKKPKIPEFQLCPMAWLSSQPQPKMSKK